MEKGAEQTRKGDEGEKKGKVEEKQMENSPYTQYKDLEDYKRQGYGTEGHLEPVTGRGAGSTDAPTISGGDAAASQHALSSTDAVNRQGVP